MAEAKTEAKRTRKPRRNYEREMSALKLYCEISIETLKDGSENDNRTLLAQGKIIAFERVLSKIGGAQ